MSAEVTTLFKDFRTPVVKVPQTNKTLNNTQINKLTNDKFEKNGSSLKTNPPQHQLNKKSWLTKENIVIGGAGLAVGVAAGTICYLKGRRNNIALRNLERKLEEKTQQFIAQSEELADFKDKFKLFLQIPENFANLKNNYVNQFQNELADAKLAYDPLSPLIKPQEDILLSYKKRVNINDIKPLVDTANTPLDKLLDTKLLKTRFATQGAVSFDIPSSAKTIPVKDKNAAIGNKAISDLGKIVETDFKLNYGQRVNWSEKKIARDMMQNFYDGHGNTLDGVKLSVEKLPTGKTKIRISGQGTFDYSNLRYLGAGDKVNNLRNAGGFGEGTKIMCANLLGNGNADKIRFASSDWVLDFSASNEAMCRTLNKTNDFLDGNYIEFETNNEKLVDAIFDSLNYFEHSLNPDFKALTFDTPEFAFKICPNEAGNIYLTQRFEFDGNGKWDDGLDGLRLIFKEKPDPEAYKRITGVALQKDRDRMQLTCDDIKNLTHYFVSDLSDETLASVLLSTKKIWTNSKLCPTSSTRTPIKSFIAGIVEEWSKRKLHLDLNGEKLVYVNYAANDTVRSILADYDYKFCSDVLDSVGLPSATEVFKQLSEHKALQPNQIEIKKMKILEKAVGLIQEDAEKLALDKVKNVSLKIATKNSMEQAEKLERLLERLYNFDDIKELLEKHGITRRKYYTDWTAYVNGDTAKINSDISAFLSEKIKDMATKKETNKIKQTLNQILISDVLDIGSHEELNSIKNLFLITKDDVTKPRYIFDRTQELATNTLGEAITGFQEYKGHWIDREYLKSAQFNQVLGTWLHEICHKSGGDGTPEFTYTLTDMMRLLLNTDVDTNKVKIAALEDIYNKMLSA